MKETELLQCKITLIKCAKVLADTYENQCKSIENFALWNLPADIGEDWEVVAFFLDSLKDNNVISETAVAKARDIIDNFDKVSVDCELYDPEIWTHNALKNHPFWMEQRKLAGELLFLIT